MKSISYVAEMQPIVPASSLPFLVYTGIIITLLAFFPTKLKLEHGFLILGLLLMSIVSNRYIALLIFLGSFVVVDLANQHFKLYITNDLEKIESFLTSPIFMILVISSCMIFTSSKLLNKMSEPYTNSDFYPLEATTYILENLDYKNIRLYNDYNVGSYLMFNEIPIFIDSRLDVYCSEFNNTEVFKDCVNLSFKGTHYEDIFSKYNFTHILLKNDENCLEYIKRDPNYILLHKDEHFTLFERTNTDTK